MPQRNPPARPNAREPGARGLTQDEGERIARRVAELLADQAHEPLMDAAQAASMLRVPEGQVRQMTRAGQLPSIRVGAKYIRYRPAALKAWICEQERADRAGGAA